MIKMSQAFEAQIISAQHRCLVALESFWMVNMVQEEHHVAQNIYLYAIASHCLGATWLGLNVVGDEDNWENWVLELTG